jgi:hypothetical protein
MVHVKRHRIAVAGILTLLVLAGLSFLRSDPLQPVPYVEEIALRIAHRGAAWTTAVVVALILLLVPFVLRKAWTSRSAALAVAAYFVLVTVASVWGNFPVPVLGYGMSPIIGYVAGWTWLRVTPDGTTPKLDTPWST